MNVLVVGATGLVGLEICRRLQETDHSVRALVRATAEAAKRAELDTLGVEMVEGDLKDPASLDRACAGVHAIISTASSTLSRQGGDSIKSVDQDGQLALVDAAVERGPSTSSLSRSGRTRASNIRSPLPNAPSNDD